MTSLHEENKRLRKLIEETTTSMRLMHTAARNLALATPDRVLRGELERATNIFQGQIRTLEQAVKDPAPEEGPDELAEARATSDLHKAAFERAKEEVKRAEDLISRHKPGCAHVRTLPDGSKDPKYSDVFLLSDEDSYDVCTCLKGFVSEHEHKNAVAMIEQLQGLLREVTDERDDLRAAAACALKFFEGDENLKDHMEAADLRTALKQSNGEIPKRLTVEEGEKLKAEAAQAREQENKFAHALETLGLQVCRALEKAMRSSPLDFQTAIAYIEILGRERDESSARAWKLEAERLTMNERAAKRENELQKKLAAILERCEHDDGCRRMTLLAGYNKGYNAYPGDGHYDECNCWLSKDLDETAKVWLEKHDKKMMAIGARDQEVKDYDDFVAWLAGTRPVGMSDAVHAALSLHDEKVAKEAGAIAVGKFQAENMSAMVEFLLKDRLEKVEKEKERFKEMLVERLKPMAQALIGLRVGPDEDAGFAEAVFVQGKAQGCIFDAKDIQPAELLRYLRELAQEFHELRTHEVVVGAIGPVGSLEGEAPAA